MKTITLRNLPPKLARALREKAAAQNTSVTRAALQLLEEATGTQPKKRQKVLHHDLDKLAGTWTKEEAAAFDKALKAQRKIDPEMWKCMQHGARIVTTDAHYRHVPQVLVDIYQT